MVQSLKDFSRPYFIGIAGTGMSAIAQYLQGIGMQVAGSDREFSKSTAPSTKIKLEQAGVTCYPQDGSGMVDAIDLVVVSSAIESTVQEVVIAKERSIPIIHRASLLALIASSKKTIAVAGTSGKSTTAAMLFDILEVGGLSPSIISGAGLTRIIQQGKIGNAVVGQGEWLVIEADESDGSIVNYHPEIGLLLNVDKDHDEITTLLELFAEFQKNSTHFSVNRSHPIAASLSLYAENDFAVKDNVPISPTIGYSADHFLQKGISIQFTINEISFTLQQLGRHNMENALAATAVANQVGVSLENCATALKQYQGIYRRHQILGTKNGVVIIDDYAHNPAKCAAAISACHPLAPKVIAWFQPHGYKPTRFLRTDFVESIAKALRPGDEIWMSEIYYAGGTAVKDISAGDLIQDLNLLGANAYFIEDRSQFTDAVRSHLTNECVLLLMGARDPSLEDFSKEVFKKL